MARRRYVSTDISVDTRVNRLAENWGDFAALLYTWMIPHADDLGELSADPEEILYTVVPGRRSRTVEDVQHALDGMAALNLVDIDTSSGKLSFPPESFYKYQTYVKSEVRRQSAENTEDQRESAENVVARALPPVSVPSPVSAPPSVSVSSSVVTASRDDNDDKPSERPWSYSLSDLTEPARKFMESFRAAYGKRKPPNLNISQVKALEDAVVDLGAERLEDAAAWAARAGVECGGGGVIKAINAARTKRLKDEEHEVAPEGRNGRGDPESPPVVDVSEWGENDPAWAKASEWLIGQMNAGNHSVFIAPIRAQRDGDTMTLAATPDIYRAITGQWRGWLRRALDETGSEKINLRYVIAAPSSELAGVT